MDNTDTAMILQNSKVIVINKKRVYLFFKRILDILFGIIGIVFLIPLSIIIKLVFIFTGDFKPIFFKQKRIGKNGKEFTMIKYRTMVPNADKVLKDLLSDKKLAYEYKKNKKIENDPRITKAGRLIRILSLDEFPQFINVFLGDMSLIGNRPYLPREKNDMGIFYDSIITTKPGLTGYWQVNGRSNVSFRRRLKLESYYSENYSFTFDIKIFFKTFLVLIGKKGAK